MVTVTGIDKHSPCSKTNIRSGDRLISVNRNEINDVLDYRYYTTEKSICLLLERDGKTFEVNIEKDEYEDTGLEFETYLMDKKRSCRNNCVFCFIDQNPEGMRESIYFKDDDERLSFLQGSYITLTNLSDKDIERIINMKISPINISVHSMNPDIRVFLTGNRFAGEALKKLYRLGESGTALNLQFVICRGINDGSDLEYSLNKVAEMPSVQSVSVVPAGMTKHRKGLCSLQSFDKKSANDVVDTVERFADEFKEKTGSRKVFCSDEFYLLAERELPCGDYYEGYLQYENGVGMLTDMKECFLSCLDCTEKSNSGALNVATGYAAYPLISELAAEFEKKFPNRQINVFRIRNDFFGETVTVSGLITGKDYIDQLNGKVGGKLLISRSSLNASGEMFLDDVTPKELEDRLGVKLITVGEDGYELCEKMATE